MKKIISNQKGIALLEMVVVTALVALLTGALSSATHSYFLHTASSNAHVTAATNIEEAARWISNDGQMAWSANVTTDSLDLTWQDLSGGNVTHDVNYSLSGDKLLRSESIGMVGPVVKTVGRYITGIEFSQPLGNDGLFTLSLTSTGGSSWVSETREYHVTLRADD